MTKRNKKNLNKGYSLIEIIIYTSLVSIVFTGAIMFLWDIISVKEKSLAINLENYSKMTKLGRGGYFASFNNEVDEFVTNMNLETPDFTDMSSINSKNIKVHTLKLDSSWELENPDLQFRSLLVNLLYASMMSGGQELMGVGLRNIDNESIVIDKIELEWTNVPSGIEVTDVHIGGTEVWHGSEFSPASIDVDNVTFTSGETLPLDLIRFNNSMAEAHLFIDFVMEDGSIARSELDLIEVEGLEPAPCSAWCEENGYSYGVCRRNTEMCIDYNETHEPDADDLCTTGPNSDTCCCKD